MTGWAWLTIARRCARYWRSCRRGNAPSSGCDFFHHLTQTQIAEQIGVSQMHISRLLRQTLAALQEQLTHDTR
jgi:hypothetical protein